MDGGILTDEVSQSYSPPHVQQTLKANSWFCWFFRSNLASCPPFCCTKCTPLADLTNAENPVAIFDDTILECHSHLFTGLTSEFKDIIVVSQLKNTGIFKFSNAADSNEPFAKADPTKIKFYLS